MWFYTNKGRNTPGFVYTVRALYLTIDTVFTHMNSLNFEVFSDSHFAVFSFYLN